MAESSGQSGLDVQRVEGAIEKLSDAMDTCQGVMREIALVPNISQETLNNCMGGPLRITSRVLAEVQASTNLLISQQSATTLAIKHNKVLAEEYLKTARETEAKAIRDAERGVKEAEMIVKEAQTIRTVANQKMEDAERRWREDSERNAAADEQLSVRRQKLEQDIAQFQRDQQRVQFDQGRRQGRLDVEREAAAAKVEEAERKMVATDVQKQILDARQSEADETKKALDQREAAVAKKEAEITRLSNLLKRSSNVLSSPEKPAQRHQKRRSQDRLGSAGSSPQEARYTSRRFGDESVERSPTASSTGGTRLLRPHLSSAQQAERQFSTEDEREGSDGGSEGGSDAGARGSSAATADYLEPAALRTSPTDLQNVWRQIEFPANWTRQDAERLLESFADARITKGYKDPQPTLDWCSNRQGKHSCLAECMKKSAGKWEGNYDAPCLKCGLGRPCVDISWINGPAPGPYDEDAQVKRWSITKRDHAREGTAATA